MSWDMRKMNFRMRKAMIEKAVGAVEIICENVINATPIGDPKLWKNKTPRRKPYIPGDLRSGWKTSLDAPDFSVKGKVKGRRWRAALSENKRILAKVTTRTKAIYMVNALPYARRIEYMGHSSKQAPEGMLRINANSSRLREAMARVVSK